MKKSNLEYDVNFLTSADSASGAGAPPPASPGFYGKLTTLGRSLILFISAAICLVLSLVSSLVYVTLAYQKEATSIDYMYFWILFFIASVFIAILSGLSVIGVGTKLKNYPPAYVGYKFWAKAMLIQFAVFLFLGVSYLMFRGSGLVAFIAIVLFFVLAWWGIKKNNRELMEESGYTRFKTFAFVLGIVALIFYHILMSIILSIYSDEIIQFIMRIN